MRNAFLITTVFGFLVNCASSNAPTPEHDGPDSQNIASPTALGVPTTSTATASAPTTVTKIMAIGDSITEFVKKDPLCPQGYRYELWKMLVDAGLHFDLVGSHSMAREYGTTYPLYQGKIFDDDVNAWGGWTTTNILNGKTSGWGAGAGNLDTWLAASTPDAVLLHIGTNDAWSWFPTATFKVNVIKIIEKLQAKNPKVIIYLAKIVPFGSATIGGVPDARVRVPEYNAQIDEIAAAKSNSLSKVVVVDQYSGYNADVDSACDKYTVHPSISGAKKMASRWMSALLKDFPASGGTITPSPTPSPTPTTLPPTPAPNPGPSSKRGAGTWYFKGNEAALANLKPAWYYSWNASPDYLVAPAQTPFVPMIWGTTHATDANFALAKKHGDTLLGFNEPDHSGQANMSVEQALALWPKFMAAGMRLGSPAAAQDPSKSGGWLDRFMSAAKAKGYRVDFIAVHWYGYSFDADIAVYQLKEFLDRIHSKYGLPIWLTEYGITNYGGSPLLPSTEVQAEFARRSVAMLESLPYVERYAWFSVPPHREDPQNTQRSLYFENGTASPIGIAYRDASLVQSAVPPKTIVNGHNLLENPGFESGAIGWGSFHQLNVALSSGVGGSKSLSAAAGAMIWQAIGRLPAGLYRASVWIRGAGAQKPVGFSLSDAINWHTLSGSWDVIPSTTWKQVSVTARISGVGAQSGIHVEFYKLSGDASIPNVDLDNFELVRVSD